MKQTAVEWLQETMDYLIPSDKELLILEIVNQAKEIEKQQIIDAYNIGFIYPIKFDFKNNKSQDAEKYYNETYEQ